MKKKSAMILATATSLSLAACSKSSSSSPSSNPSPSSTTGTTTTSTSSLSVSDLALVPSLDTFLKAQNTTASLALSRALRERQAGLGLTTGTPPLFVDIANGMGTYLTGDLAAAKTAITTDLNNSSWAALDTQIKSFFDAEAKCNVIQDTAHIIERLRQDTSGLCLLQAVGPIGNEVYVNESGVAISDLTTVFTPTADDKIIQIGNTDKGQPHYEMVKVTGTTNNATGYHLVYSTCVSSTKKAERQNVLDINNTTGVLTFTSANNGEIDDSGVKPSATFTLTGTMMASGSAFVPDPSKARTVTYNGSGSIGPMASTEQGALTISGNELAATFFAISAGADPNNAAQQQTRSEKTALDVAYTGTDTADLTIYEGAGRSIMTMTGVAANGTGTVTNTDDHKIGFDFDNTASPEYTNVTTSTYLTNIGNINFATDSILSETTPTGPDLTKIDDAACSATPTTVLNYIAKPEDNTVYNAAMTACNTLPAQGSDNMCQPLIDAEHFVNQGMAGYKGDVGGTPNY